MDFELWLSFANDLFLLFLGVGVEIEVNANSAKVEVKVEAELGENSGQKCTQVSYEKFINIV